MSSSRNDDRDDGCSRGDMKTTIINMFNMIKCLKECDYDVRYKKEPTGNSRHEK